MMRKVVALLRDEIESRIDAYLAEAVEKVVSSRREKAVRDAGPRRERARADLALTQLETAILSEIKKQPGQKVGALGEATGYAGKPLYRAVERLVLKGEIRAAGLRGAMSYYPLPPA